MQMKKALREKFGSNIRSAEIKRVDSMLMVHNGLVDLTESHDVREISQTTLSCGAKLREAVKQKILCLASKKWLRYMYQSLYIW